MDLHHIHNYRLHLIRGTHPLTLFPPQKHPGHPYVPHVWPFLKQYAAALHPKPTTESDAVAMFRPSWSAFHPLLPIVRQLCSAFSFCSCSSGLIKPCFENKAHLDYRYKFPCMYMCLFMQGMMGYAKTNLLIYGLCTFTPTCTVSRGLGAPIPAMLFFPSYSDSLHWVASHTDSCSKIDIKQKWSVNEWNAWKKETDDWKACGWYTVKLGLVESNSLGC